MPRKQTSGRRRPSSFPGDIRYVNPHSWFTLCHQEACSFLSYHCIRSVFNIKRPANIATQTVIKLIFLQQYFYKYKYTVTVIFHFGKDPYFILEKNHRFAPTVKSSSCDAFLLLSPPSCGFVPAVESSSGRRTRV